MNISDINTLARRIVGADSTSYTAANLLIDVNAAYEEIVGKLIVLTSGGQWSFGDSNFTSLPTGLVTLVNSQEAYQLTGNGTTGVNTTTPLIDLVGVSVKDKNGTWNVLQPITLWDLLESGTDPAEYFSTDGLPLFYEKREDFLVLYPAPDNGITVTLTSGLKVFFQRTASLFTSAEVTTGTKVPGFASPFHPLIAYKAALPFAIANVPDRVPVILREIDRLEAGLLKFYAQKGDDVRKSLSMKGISAK